MGSRGISPVPIKKAKISLLAKKWQGNTYGPTLIKCTQNNSEIAFHSFLFASIFTYITPQML